MAPLTVPDLVVVTAEEARDAACELAAELALDAAAHMVAFALRARESAGHAYGTAVARIIVRRPATARRALEWLERLGVPGPGWPLTALAMLSAAEPVPPIPTPMFERTVAALVRGQS